MLHFRIDRNAIGELAKSVILQQAVSLSDSDLVLKTTLFPNDTYAISIPIFA